MGYREYLKENQAQKSDLLKDVRNKVREALTRFGSIQREWLAEVQQIRATLPAPGAATPRTAEPCTRREGFFASHDDALAALFPDRITSFFPEHIQQQLTGEETQEPPLAEEALQDIEVDSIEDSDPEETAIGLELWEPPVLMPLQAAQETDNLHVPDSMDLSVEGDEDSLERIRNAFRKLVSPSEDGETSTHLKTELKRVMNLELSVRKPAIRARNGRIQLDERNLDRINEGNFQMLLRNNKHLSNNINRLADSYFRKNGTDEEDSWIPGI